ncbi:MAG: hypothetical protein RLZZ628_1101 [Bacteroidota bacterium]|jgi:hypothetical protein
MHYKKTISIIKTNLLLCAVAMIGITACSKYDLGMPTIQANAELSLPLARLGFVFSDFLKGDSIIQLGKDSSITMRYAQDSLASYKTADLIPKAAGGLLGGVNKNAALGTLSIPDLNLSPTIALSQLGAAFPAPLDDFCTNGGTAVVASGAFSTTSAMNSNLPLLSGFQSVSLASGTLSLQLTNNFPFALQNLNLDLINTNTGDVVATLLMGANLAKGGTATGTANLTGKTMTNQLTIRVGKFDCPGVAAGTVLLSTETLAMTISIANMKVKSGVVKIPAQSLPGDNMIVPFATSNPAQKFAEVTLKSAAINYSIRKTTRANVALSLTFPTITQDGAPITEIITATEENTTGAINLTDAIVNLASLAGQPYNQVPVQVGISIISSGGSYVPINETEQITTNIAFANAEVSAAKGQFGNFELDIPASNQNIGANLNFLTPESKRLLFANPVMRIKTLNSFGMNINTDLLMTATGVLTGTENLGLAADAGHLKFDIARPTIGQIATPAQLVAGTNIIDKNSSNIVQFMGILPKTIATSGKVSIRSTGAQMDYFTADSRVKLGLEMDIPIKFSTENLIVRDTVTTFANLVTTAQGQNLDYAIMDVQYKTRLPMSITVDLATLKDGVLKAVATEILLPAADAIDATGRVTAAKSGTFEVKLTSAQLVELSAAPKVVMVVKIKTAGSGATPVTMYSHYDLNLGIGIRLKVKV